MGMRGSATCELSFDNIHLPADALLGSLGMGFKMAMQALDGRPHQHRRHRPPASPSTP